ncbi:MAG: ShlB/FhaC/HecB family hemolysin secretion/activation protein [Verrucomicrobiales bacterium]|nr:ShlB/FhaC/HecB family hemolysin secretion/activation protein [Verrucomicrobiales bacterium]
MAQIPLRGVVLVEDWKGIQWSNPRTDVTNLVVESPEFLREWEPELNSRLGRMNVWNRDLFEGDGAWLTNILREVVSVCRVAGHPVVDVFFPTASSPERPEDPIEELNIRAGRLHLVVIEGRVDSVETRLHRRPMFGTGSREVTGDSQRIERRKRRLQSQLGLEVDSVIESTRLQRALQTLNRQADYQQAGLTLQQGATIGGVNVTLDVTNRPPVEPFLGYDDAGNTLIGWPRLFAGTTLYNLWGAGHRMAYQFTADPEFSAYLTHSASYTAPLGKQHSVMLYGGYSDLDLDLGQVSGLPSGAGSLSQQGANWMAGLRYSVALPGLTRPDGGIRYRHELFVGFEYKDIETTLLFAAEALPSSAFVVAQFVGGYRGLLVDRFGTNVLTLQVVGSPGGIGSGNTDEAFATASGLRATPTADYVYGKVDFARDTPLVHRYLDWELAATFQGSFDPLVASEQLGLGGADSVRGFEQSVALGDSGFFIRNDLGFQLPALNRLLGFGGEPAQVKFGPFFDYGVAYASEGAPYAGDSSMDMGGVGVGLRLQWGRHIEARVDYAVQVIGRDAERVGNSVAEDIDSRFHVYARVRF